jgi:hypothetical protein
VNKWTRRIDAATEKQNRKLAEWQRQVNEEKARGINRLDNIQKAVILFIVAVMLALVSFVLLAGWMTIT